MMNAWLGLVFSIHSLTNLPVPAGAQLHVRLTSTVGSYSSTAGSPVSAVLIAPIIVDGATLLPAGSALTGRVKAVARVGLGIRHETAGLDLEFDQLVTADGEDIPISARVADVDNSRERVTANGYIHGIRSTGSLSYRVSGYIRTLLTWEPHYEIAEWAIKSLIGDLPEPEIYYPAGVELTLTLTDQLLVNRPISREPTNRQLSDSERAELDSLIGTVPDRTVDPGSGRSSDLTNVLLIGTQNEVVTAFAAAGWIQANPVSLRQRIKWIRAAAELRGYGAGPMSPLLLGGAEPDMSWEKGLNDVSKRHHVRIWRAGTWRGQDLWVGAATRDIDFAYLRPGQRLTHKIDENIDQERDKVAYDLAFTSCSSLVDWTHRTDFPRLTRNGTGDPIITDANVAVIGLQECAEPRLSTENFDIEPIPPYGRKLERFARREILSARNDLLRTNLYWRTFEGGRFLVGWARRRWQESRTEAVLKEPTVGLHRSASLALVSP